MRWRRRMLRRQRRSNTPGADGANNARDIRRAYRACERLPGGYTVRFVATAESAASIAVSIARYLDWQADQLRALCPGFFAKVLS